MSVFEKQKIKVDLIVADGCAIFLVRATTNKKPLVRDTCTNFISYDKCSIDVISLYRVTDIKKQVLANLSTAM